MRLKTKMKAEIKDSILVKACNMAVDQRRTELNTRKLELIKFSPEMEPNPKLQWKSYSQLCPHEIVELAKIETELQIIDHLMIKTQQIFQKLGGQIKVEIRRSDIPDEYYDSLNEVKVQ